MQSVKGTGRTLIIYKILGGLGVPAFLVRWKDIFLNYFYIESFTTEILKLIFSKDKYNQKFRRLETPQKVSALETQRKLFQHLNTM